jgi:hypothetical protein
MIQLKIISNSTTEWMEVGYMAYSLAESLTGHTVY